MPENNCKYQKIQENTKIIEGALSFRDILVFKTSLLKIFRSILEKRVLVNIVNSFSPSLYKKKNALRFENDP